MRPLNDPWEYEDYSAEDQAEIDEDEAEAVYVPWPEPAPVEEVRS